MPRTPLMMALGIVWIGSTMLVGSQAAVQAPQPPAIAEQVATFIGADACRGCHMQQHAAWSETKHARALSKLGGADQASGKCIRCHVTGTPAMIEAEGATPSFPNVQCEACHGPGRAHVEAARTGRAATVRNATIEEATCTRCHNETSPHYKTFIFIALKGMVHRTP